MFKFKLKELVEFLDYELDIVDINDTSLNGLQVEGRKDIQRVGLAVDASLEAFKRAEKSSCDFIIVHHGLFWDKPFKLTGILGERIKFLMEKNISLYAAHLPLDKHEFYGNNAQLAKIFGLQNIEDFGEYKKMHIGFSGELEEEMDFEEFAKEVKEKLKTAVKAFPFGKKKVKKIAIISGGGSFAIHEAVAKDIDVLLTGETRHSSFYTAKDGKLNVLFAGHYATETVGLKALGNLIKEKFDIEVGFIDIPTGL